MYIWRCKALIWRLWTQQLGTKGVGAGTRLSQLHDTQLYKNISSYTDFTICTVLNWLTNIQLCTQIIANRATVYPTWKLSIQLCNCIPSLSGRKKLYRMMSWQMHQWGSDEDWTQQLDTAILIMYIEGLMKTGSMLFELIFKQLQCLLLLWDRTASNKMSLNVMLLWEIITKYSFML